ncbi:hypothetical protein [uncultured Bradyrhizobium sp.]|uniref:Uncharacterized protein n=1 Tax=Candidatus Afipia apatlaquensis TaxID=2712852 RepID=A0A7C9RFV1_9BRAD|nr:hypothetical protein [uncultured Bradyrhizobium sp.]NGX96385.1 hypothetical protein [Candidatus Afipia apatlaquensis]
MPATLTTANSVLALTTEALFPAAQVLTGYAADNIFETDAVENGEYSMGIDGNLSAGFVYNEIPFTLTLQADSPALKLFEQIYGYEVANRTKLTNNLTITLPALGRRYDLKKGFMRSYKAPAGQKILQPGVVAFVFARQEMSNL